MTPFERQLANLRNEAHLAACHAYAELTVRAALSKSRRLLSKVNRTPTFWKLTLQAHRSAAILAICRAFDSNGNYNLHNLLKSAEVDIAQFSRDALAARREAQGMSTKEAAEYASTKYELKVRDVERLRRIVESKRVLYTRAFHGFRNRHLVHRVEVDPVRVSALHNGATVRDYWTLALFLGRLHMALWESYTNGHAPRLGRQRYSINGYFRKTPGAALAHERMIGDAQTLMATLESAAIVDQIPVTWRR